MKILIVTNRFSSLDIGNLYRAISSCMKCDTAIERKHCHLDIKIDVRMQISLLGCEKGIGAFSNDNYENSRDVCHLL